MEWPAKQDMRNCVQHLTLYLRRNMRVLYGSGQANCEELWERNAHRSQHLPQDQPSCKGPVYSITFLDKKSGSIRRDL